MLAGLPIRHVYNPVLDLSTLVVDVEFSHKPSWRTPFSVSRLLDCACILGVVGGLGGNRLRHGQSTDVVGRPRVNEQGASWHFHGLAIDTGAQAVLANVLAFSHRNAAPLNRADICSAHYFGEQGPPQLRGCREDLPFTVELSADSPDIYIEIEFVEPVPTHSRRLVGSTLLAWQWLAAAGAFEARHDSAQHPLLVLEHKPAWEEQFVAMRLADASFDEVAFDALANAMQGFHYRGSPIATIDIS